MRVVGAGRQSIQGDVRFVEALQQMGATITMGENWIEARSNGVLKAVDMDFNHIPDAAMTIAVAALYAWLFIVLPLFLGTGKHAREDIPRLLDELRRQHPDCRFDLQTAAGENPRVTSLLAQLALEAAAGSEALKHTDFK